jgi:hypothetical protein
MATTKYQDWYKKFSKESIDPNELSANAFGAIVWEAAQEAMAEDAVEEFGEFEKAHFASGTTYRPTTKQAFTAGKLSGAKNAIETIQELEDRVEFWRSCAEGD